MEHDTASVTLGTGAQLGDYEIVAVAGSGGMGVVYTATQRSLGRSVALKVIRDEIARLPEYRDRFLREARLAASVDHPNIVSVYDVGDENGRLFLALQWIEGRDLKRMLQESGRLSPERAVAITSQLCGALDALHGFAGLIHRDIKPANVLIRPMTTGDHAYLTDFGVAKPTGRNDGFTQTGWVVGTAGYVSPEQIRGEEPGPRSDLYALGCLFFETLTGQPPFRGDNEMALRWAHANDPRPRPSAVIPSLGERYDGFFASALALDPADRFGSGREFATALAAAHGQAPGPSATVLTTPSHPVTAVGPPTPVPNTPPPQTPAPVYPAYGYVTPAPAPSQNQRSGSPLALILLGLVALAGIGVGALAAAGAFSHGSTVTTTTRAIIAAGSRHTVKATSAAKHRGHPPNSPAKAGAVPSGSTSCGGGVYVGPNTSCGFAQNVQHAYSQTSGGYRTVTAYSPATGSSFAIDCSGGTPHVCKGGTTHDASLYFVGAGSGATSPAPTTGTALPSPPGNVSACGQNVSAGPYTSCPFANNVLHSYAAQYQNGGSQDASNVSAYSPVTNQSYAMSCVSNETTVVCTGGNQSYVSFPLSAAKNY